ncbi:DUF4870 domain-containing protein [Poritiphilus flavus]|uniref:DUF4870 domain-containing protein n=1 Tax=Poritiphilus flavus TaxID=2697053 RepID=A0A6L9EA89_9FLAO|nr:DUF4870 domain-containing protein [Poritiphilus flavus]NAS11563.1 DUF4870 domain-containing protein [Poritiphilus flavus]
MAEAITKHERNLSAIIHASTFSKYFIPFGNFLVPLVLWLSNKNDHEFVDYNGKQALNFQISILLYGLLLAVVTAVMFLIFAFDFVGFINILDINEHDLSEFGHHYSGFGIHIIVMVLAGIFGLGLLVLDVVCTILAAIKGGNGERYQYPFTINFIK